MSREAADRGFERFVDETIEATRREFSVARALRDTGLGPGGAIIDRLRENAGTLERLVVEPEFATYRRRSVEQYRVVLDYVESDGSFEAFEDELLEHDNYVRAFDGSATEARREAVLEDVLARLERLGEGVRPIVERPEDEFWPAVTAALDRGEALELIEEVFPFTGPLRRHRDAFAFEVEIDPGDVLGGPLAGGLPGVSVEYTDEAIRAMRRAERAVVRETKAEVRDRYG
ncbi:MAG: hypothetical protein ABEI39_02780 [Halobacteriales archaeon]